MEWVLMDIAEYRLKIPCIIYRLTFIPLLEQIACAVVFPIIPSDKFDLDFLHDFIQGNVCVLDQQMDMIVHQTVRI